MAEEHESDWGEFKAELRSLNLNVARLTEVVDQNTKQLNKVEVLEVNHLHQSQAIGRAFGEIKVVQDTQDEDRTEQAKKNNSYDKYVWTTTGFVLAVCCFWTLMGYRIQQQVDETLKTVAEFRIHIVRDRITDIEDIRRIHESLTRPHSQTGGNP